MLLLIDNYDSFTYNLFHFLGELGAETEVVRNDVETVPALLDRKPRGVVISPGPCDPDRAGVCLALIEELASAGVPTLGVCLGHQAIGQVFGGKVVRAPEPMHGKVDRVTHDRTGVFAGLPDSLSVTRYHSLIVDRPSLPEILDVNAWSDDGLIMGVRHKSLPIHGVQFHPESIATEQGHDLLANFLRLIEA